LDAIPFPALPKLLLSATDLVCLGLENIPRSGYFSPEAIVTGLAVLTDLKFMSIGFESYFPRGFPVQGNRRPPPPTRTVLPALTRFHFEGSIEYMEDLVARIDAPLLNSGYIWIAFSYNIGSHIKLPQFAQFMKRTPNFQAFNEAHVHLFFHGLIARRHRPLTRMTKMAKSLG
jgi:hypothetical protein